MKTIGIKLADGSFYPIMEEGSAQNKALELTTAHNNQTCVMVDLYRSKTCSMDDAEYIDTLKIENLKEHPNGEPSISFNVGLDENGELTTSINDPETGASSSSEITLVSRTVEERLQADDYSISDPTQDENNLADDSGNGKLGAAALGAVAGAGLMAAAAGLLNKEDEAPATESDSLPSDDFTLGDPSFNEASESDNLVLPDLDDNSIFEDNSVAENEVENTDDAFADIQTDEDTIADEVFADNSISDETMSDETIADEQMEVSTGSTTDDVDDTFADETIVDEPAADETMSDETIADEQMEVSTGSTTDDVDDTFANETLSDDSFADIPTSEDTITDDNAFADIPSSEETISDESFADEPAADETIVDEPAADETIIDEPAAEDSLFDDSTVIEDPFTDESGVVSTDSTTDDDFGSTNDVGDDDNFDLPDFPEEENLEDTSSEDLFDDEPAPATANGLSFTGLYDKETAMGESSNYEDENNGKKTKSSVIICIICAIICIVATALILFVVPSRYNLLTNHKNKKEETPIEKTVEPVKPAEVQPVKTEETNLAKKDEVVVIEKAEEVKPLPPPTAEKEEAKVTYKIKWGDTLWDIADNYYKNPWKYKKIANYNNIKNPDHIVSGTVITIPEE